MWQKLLSLQWKEAIRSPFFEKSLGINILLGIVVLYFVLNFLVLGFYLDKLLIELFDDDPVYVFGRLALYYLLFDLIMRFVVQQFPALSIQPYLHLPIPKKKLFHYLLVKSIPHFFNFAPFLLIVPFFIKAVLPVNTLLGSAGWLLAFVALIMANNFFSYYLKKIFSVSQILPIAILLLVGVVFYLDMNGYISLSTYFGQGLSAILEQPLWALIPVALAVFSYYFVFRQMQNYAYLEDISIKSNRSEVETKEFKFLEYYGKMGEIIQLELKLIWRNKRPKTMTIMGFIFPLYFLFMMFGSPEIMDNAFFLIFTGVFATGMVMMNYGQFMLSWESSFFDGLLTRNLSIKDYFHGIYLLFALAGGLFTLLFSFVIFWNLKFGLTIITLGLFNIGVTSLFLFFFSTYNKKRIDLGKSAFMNYEGVGASQFLLMVPIIFVPLLLFLLFRWLTGSDLIALAVLGVFGFVSILLRNPLIDLIVKQFKSRRYAMAAGFRKK